MRGVSALRTIVAAGLLAAAGAALPAGAQDDAGFQAYLPQLRAVAEAKGVTRSTLDQVFATLVYSQRVVDLDRAQPGATDPNAPAPPFAPYKAKHLTPALIARGQQAWAANRYRLQAIERQTGVPESIMVAIWGNETSYGVVMGGFDLPSALATLAYEGRRRDLFAAEFIAALQIIDRGVRQPGAFRGSWAGATGGPQFLPSAYFRLARDGDGDGRADIWNSEADTLASIANYFVNAGWRPGQPWGFAVGLPPGFARGGVANRLLSPRCPRVFARHSGWR